MSQLVPVSPAVVEVEQILGEQAAALDEAACDAIVRALGGLPAAWTVETIPTRDESDAVRCISGRCASGGGLGWLAALVAPRQPHVSARRANLARLLTQLDREHRRLRPA